MRYAIWYDNSSGFLEPFLIVEADDAREAVRLGLGQGLPNVIVTAASESSYGFGNDPNQDNRMILMVHRDK